MAIFAESSGAPRVLTYGYVQEIETICDESSVEANLCTKEELGSFILAANATDVSKSPIISKTIHLNNPVAVNYPVKRTGFYCVSTYGYSGRDYTAMVEFRNAYGELPAAQIAKLPFYGALTIVYAVIGMYVDNAQVMKREALTTVLQILGFLICAEPP